MTQLAELATPDEPREVIVPLGPNGLAPAAIFQPPAWIADHAVHSRWDADGLSLFVEVTSPFDSQATYGVTIAWDPDSGELPSPPRGVIGDEFHERPTEYPACGRW